MPLEIITIPCLDDNYAFLMRCQSTGQTAVVDVPDAAPIQAELKNQGWELNQILITHHHDDHIQGVDTLKAATGATVVGALADKHRLPVLDVELSDGDTINVGDESADIIDVSGHTINHIAFLFKGAKAAFTADSLMAMGCGRVFEGTKPQMWESLQKFTDLDPETMVYSGHEYTTGNINFALSIDPDNTALVARASQVETARAAGEFTVPSKLGEELATNPFLRADDPALQAALGMTGQSSADVFTEIRTRKDNF